MVQLGLPEDSNRNGVRSKDLSICSASRMDVGEKLRAEQSWPGLHRLKRAHAANHLAAVVPCHPHRSDVASPLVNVQVGGTGHVGAAVGEGHCALRITGKGLEKLLSYSDRLVRL